MKRRRRHGRQPLRNLDDVVHNRFVGLAPFWGRNTVVGGDMFVADTARIRQLLESSSAAAFVSCIVVASDRFPHQSACSWDPVWARNNHWYS